MAWIKLAIVAGVLAFVGWLFLSPPTVPLGTERIDCRPLGWELQDAGSLDGYDSTVGLSGSEAIERSLEGETDPERLQSERAQAEAGLLAACGDARENRMAGLGVTIAAALALLVVSRTRRLFDVPVTGGPEPAAPAATTSADSVPAAAPAATPAPEPTEP